MPTHRYFALGLLAVVAFALVLRARGIDHLLPYKTEPDGHIVSQAVLMRAHDPAPEENRNWGKYPHVVARVASLFPLLEEEALPPEHRSTETGLDAHLAAASRPFLVTRWTVLGFSLLAVLGTGLAARRFLPAPWALVAAAFTATSLLAMNYAQQARPHAAASGCILMAVVAALHLRREPSVKSWALAGGASAVAVGSLQFGASVLASVAAAFLLRDRSRSPGAGRTALGMALFVALLAASVPLFQSYLLDGPAEGDEAVFEVRGKRLHTGGHVIYLNAFDGSGFGKVAYTLATHEPGLTALAVVGLLALCVPRRRAKGPTPGRGRDLLVVLAHALPFVVVVGMYRATFARFALPLVPYLALLAACGTRELARLAGAAFARAVPGRVTVVAVCVLVFALPTAVVWRLGTVRSSPDTLALAAEYIAGLPDAADARIVAAYDVDLPAFRREPLAGYHPVMLEEINSPYTWVRYQRTIPLELRPEPWDLKAVRIGPNMARPREVLMAADPTYVVLRRSTTGSESLRAILAESGELLTTISPHRPGVADEHPFEYLLLMSRSRVLLTPIPMAKRVFDAERPGPVIEIYRWR